MVAAEFSRLRFRNLDRRLVTILLIIFVQMLGAAMILPILPLYAQREFDLSPEIIALPVEKISGAYLDWLAAGCGD